MRLNNLLKNILRVIGIRTTPSVDFVFLGWKNAELCDQYHDSPEFFETEWVAGRIPNAPPYPIGLYALHEKNLVNGERFFSVDFDQERLTTEDVVKILHSVGMDCRLKDS